MNNKKFLRELWVNFALLYSFILGTLFVSYSIYRGFYNFSVYTLAFVSFLIYLTFWIVDKRKFLSEGNSKNDTTRTENPDSV